MTIQVEEDDILPAELRQGLDSIVLQIDNRDQFSRDRLIRVYKRNEYFWEGLQNIYFSEVAHDWRYIAGGGDSNPDEDVDIENKVVNIFRAHGEIIIAAVA